jgi:predicted kinase
MATPLLCHLLIGPPGSGKTTLARQMQQRLPQSHLVSTDQIRHDLYGDEATQGQWPDIEAVVLQQINHALDQGNPVIYDATNARRVWRMGLLQTLNRANVLWVGWQLTTPLKTCHRWNQSRQRSVEKGVIDAMAEGLKQFPPLPGEGFVAVYAIDPAQGIEGVQAKLDQLHRSITNRSNRTRHGDIQLHRYSSLLAFDRLMHLISLLVAHPGLGDLHTQVAEALPALGGNIATPPDDSLDEICQVIAVQKGSIYADPEEIAIDLQWLDTNGLLSSTPRYDALTCPTLQTQAINPHPYSDWDAFQRLLVTIRFISHHPFCWQPAHQSSLASLVEAMATRGLIEGGRQAAIRKDFERVLKPFGILPPYRQRRGYFIGSGILSEQQLLRVAGLLQAQAKTIQDPVALSILDTLRVRLQRSQQDLDTLYPVRAIANRTIVKADLLPSSAMVRTTEQLEADIEAGRLMEVNRFVGGGRFDDHSDDFVMIWPLQIVFHNIGWYLGYEIAAGPAAGLLQFERLDRLFRGQPQSRQRSLDKQQKALDRLQKLHQACGGLYLGNDPKQQQKFLSPRAYIREPVTITLELWFTDKMFAFISEGTQRFPDTQMQLSPKPGETKPQKDTLFCLPRSTDSHYPHRFRVQLPQWSIHDRDLRRWIIGFGAEVKVVSPPAMMQQIATLAREVATLYGATEAVGKIESRHSPPEEA